MNTQPKYTSIATLQADLRAGIISCQQLVAYYLEQIIRHNPTLNAFVSVYAEEAQQRAIEIDQKIANQTAGRLAGVVLGIKDVLCYQNHGLRAGSKILEGFVSQFTATAIQRLLDEDAIIIGRQNCDEFAMGSSNENSAFGPVRNAADTSRVPGGSSGGSAVAVQADMCLASIGSDTGGSVRQPAAFCGLVGLKPTYGRISRWGLVAYGSSFDCIGPITHTVEDAAILLEIMAGADDFDSTVSYRPIEKYSEAMLSDKTKLRIGYLSEGVESEGVQAEIREATLATITWLRQEGHIVEPVNLEGMAYLLPTYYILTTAEASSNLSRFDGVRYGYRSETSEDIISLYKKTRAEGFGSEVKRRIMLGTFVLSASYYDAYYTKAQKVRRLLKEQTEQLFEKYDFLLTPTTPTTAFRLGDKTQDPLQMYLADIFTVQANVIGNPAISIPNGNDAQGLPIGLQILGKPFEESALIAFAQYLHQSASVSAVGTL
ncbi:MAG: Asp-tRNA(Asn)/Glu-tRNA(Gln) amidotransferase subunit GatA [Runella sp.]